MLMIIGVRITMNSAGKMKKMSGKSILIGIFCARSSAIARRRLRISIERLRIVVPMETPSRSPCVIARTKMFMFVASARRPRLAIAWPTESPILCSWRVSRSSWPSGSAIVSDATRIDARIPRPASIVTTSRSIMSGSCLSISSIRLRRFSST